MPSLTKLIVNAYRKLAPQRVRQSCRFEPSCSEYCLLAVEKHGFWKGWKMTIKRLIQCKPPQGGTDWP
ncbi:membrane protein insertion efficiency factor YidD [Paenalcaligenes niemegkensis]|uniref:membrane protein insertion efficiency factor YidD n=1 Tax=Paenalcaligenes niemegkensis TaxID=2895469 RepID=UPI001EE87CEE|nr:membrane protein insertion efficiency factor YidD [Paenalcaligenes niemegkensis]MCQ9618362.1 membrane protein insertion efficiency factor YidD [Paenalcaligenes niemegkensis]